MVGNPGVYYPLIILLLLRAQGNSKITFLSNRSCCCWVCLRSDVWEINFRIISTCSLLKGVDFLVVCCSFVSHVVAIIPWPSPVECLFSSLLVCHNSASSGPLYALVYDNGCTKVCHSSFVITVCCCLTRILNSKGRALYSSSWGLSQHYLLLTLFSSNFKIVLSKRLKVVWYWEFHTM